MPASADRRYVSSIAVPVVAAMLVVAAGTARADEGRWELDLAVGLEARWFPDDPIEPRQLAGTQSSVSMTPEAHWRSTDRRHLVSTIGFLRADGRDDERTHADVRELSYRFLGDGWELMAGIGRVFWGVTESRHLVDIVNQDDVVEDIDREDKLGQPMVNVAWQRAWGRIDAFALVGYREPTYPGGRGRLRAPLPVDADSAVWESSAENRRVDLAVRYSHFVGDWDFGIYAFEGTSREARLEPDPTGQRLIPRYDVIEQLGGDVQLTRGAWLGKLESIVRSGHDSTFWAGVAGVEYTVHQAVGAADISVLAEYLRDERDAGAPVTAFDDDLFVGSRLAWNDTQGTALLVGAIVDRNDGSTAGRIEFERRLGNRALLEVEGRWFSSVDGDNLLSAFERDSFVTVRVTTFF